MLLDERAGLGRVEAAHHREDAVRGNEQRADELAHVGGGHALQLVHEADDRAVERVRRGVEPGKESLDRKTVGRVDVAQVALLKDHAAVPLDQRIVDERRHGAQAVGGDPERQRQFFRGHHRLEGKRLEVGGGVEVAGAAALEQAKVVGVGRGPARHHVLDQVGHAAAARRLVERAGAEGQLDHHARDGGVGREKDDEAVGKLEALQLDGEVARGALAALAAVVDGSGRQGREQCQEPERACGQ